MTEVRIGIVGMGVQGSLYANILTGTSIPYMPPIRKPEGLALTAVSSRSEQAKEFASHLEGVTYFSDWKEMIDSNLCDAIVITVPAIIPIPAITPPQSQCPVGSYPITGLFPQ